jgi:nonsense-mediated mRNA decay protein 3
MNQRERAVKRPDMPSFRVYRRSEDLQEAVVVSKGKGEVQIMDPSNYSTVDLSVPDGAEIGETVKVVDIDDALYYVP